MDSHYRFLIIGAGLTGLSTAFHLGNDYIVLEKECRPGGLCRTVLKNGFYFDYTGHLLHLNDEYTKTFVHTMFGERLTGHQRKASIHFKGHQVPFPFQANLSYLPAEVTRDCLLGFIKTQCGKTSTTPESFYDWVCTHLGEGLARHFFIPYNEKLYGARLREMTPEWCERFVPKPDLEETVNGALGLQHKTFGYNASFLYPDSGGIQILPDALSSQVDPIRLQTSVVQIDWLNKTALTCRGEQIRYSALVSTTPLYELVDMLEPLPHEIRNARKALRWRSVLCIALGIRRSSQPSGHWIYFPGLDFTFYRVGYYHNFSDAMAPDGCFSLYAEVALEPELEPDIDLLVDKTKNDLFKAGILQTDDEILVTEPLYIPCAYIVYNRERTSALSSIVQFLHSNDIYSEGRYGEWKYSSMEDALMDGRKIAEHLKQK